MRKPDAQAIVSVDPESHPDARRASRLDRLDDAPFSVLVVGDFSGSDMGAAHQTADASDAESVSWSAVRVESPDELMRRLRPRVLVESEHAQSALLELRQMEDFHPDRLLERFAPLQAMMRAIDSAGVAASDADAAIAGSPQPDEHADRQLLDEIVGAAQERPTTPDALDEWIRRAVAPHTSRADAVGELEARRGLSARAMRGLRAVLRAPALRRIEALWRDLTSLAAAVGQASGCRLYALDVSRADVEKDLMRDELEASRLLDSLLAPLAGTSAPPALIVGAYTFGSSTRDAALANRLAMLASVVGSPWISGADLSLVGITDITSPEDDWDTEQPEPEAWTEFRATQAASAFGLAIPGVLARPAYGRDWEPCRLLEGFEEVEDADDPDPYVWGNPAFLSARLAVERFGDSGWSFDPYDPGLVSGLFTHVLMDGAVGAYPTRQLLSTRATEALAARGLMAVLAHRDEPRAIVPGLRSIASASPALAAWWSGLVRGGSAP